MTESHRPFEQLRKAAGGLRSLWERIAHAERGLIEPDRIAAMKRRELEHRSRSLVGAIALGDGTVLARALGRSKIYLRADDEGLARHVMMDGYWNASLTQFIAGRVGPGMSVVEVGANHGYYSLLLAGLVGPSGRVAAIEAEPRTAALLKRSIALNGLGGWTTVCSDAASSVDGRKVLLVSPRGESQSARILPGGGLDEDYEGFFVETIRLDRLLSDWTKVDFVKIDVCGHEEAVIEGMAAILGRDRPRLVLTYNVARCARPELLFAALTRVYERAQFVGTGGRLESVSTEVLLDRTASRDWTLYYE